MYLFNKMPFLGLTAFLFQFVIVSFLQEINLFTNVSD